MSKQLDVSDPSKLSKDDLNYALQRYLITPEVAREHGLHVPEEFGDEGGGELPQSMPVEPERPTMGAGSDPADFKAVEVIEYLNGLDEDDDAAMEEFNRVIEAEREGESRKTILALAEED